MMKFPLVTVVIPSKNRLPGIESLITDISRQNYPRDCIQILIIDDGSTPPYELFSDNITLIRHIESRGAQFSRNEGIRKAKGDIILMMDDDIELIEDDFISRAVTIFQKDNQVAAVVSKKIDVITHHDQQKTREFSTSHPAWYSGDLVKTNSPEGCIDWGHGIYFCRRDVLLEIGGYDGIYGLNGGHSFREESDVHARIRNMGYKIWYLPQITIRHKIVSSGGHGANTGTRLYWIAHNHIIFLHRHLAFWPLRAGGFLLDVLRYSWVQGRFRYLASMLCGYAAGWRNALRDKGPGRNQWLD